MSETQIIIAGAAGEGSKKAGLLIAKLFNAYGFRVFIHEDYESVIKGGHNFSQISVSKKESDAIKEKIDFLLALNKEAISKHKEKLKKGGVLMYDSDVIKNNFSEEEKVEIAGIPLGKIVEKAEGIPIMKNTGLVAAFSRAVGMEWKKVREVLEKELPIATEKNLKVAEIAFRSFRRIKEIKETGEEPAPLLSGNQAAALGAINAGLENYFAYPMTPSTGILQFLSQIEGVRTFQPENEIATVNMALGSAYAGKRTMVGTSGGGFALMTEGVSFSAQSEIPLVISLSQRAGPATGVPTYQGQGDLLFALNAGHGDMTRFVVAPGDVNETYYFSGKALNMAWKYQLPAIVLLDKELSENTYSFDKSFRKEKEEAIQGEMNGGYNRYDREDISPLAFPGGGAVVKATGYEHDKKGVATEDAEAVKKMQEKRMRKYEKLKEEVEDMESVNVQGEGPMAVVFWGSTKGVALRAVKDLDVRLVQPIILQPFPEKKMKKALSGVKKIIVAETNATGQLSRVLKEYGIKVSERILKYDGRPFSVEELRKRIKANI